MTKTGRGMFNSINLAAALRLYYERLELNCDDVREIFGPMGSTTMSRMKKQAREQMVKDGNPPIWDARHVPADLEMRLAKLRKLGLEEGE